MTLQLQSSLTGFTAAEDVAIRSDNTRLAAADTNAHAVRWSDIGGALQYHASGAYGTSGSGLAFPEALVFEASGAILVLDLWNKRVARFTAAAGSYAFDGSYPYANGVNVGGKSMGRARDMALDAGGVLWVLDGDHQRVLRLTQGGAATAIALGGVLRDPRGFALLPGGGFAVADVALHVVRFFDAAGNVTATIGGYGTGAQRLRGPMHVAVAPDNTLWVADSHNGRIVHCSLQGAPIGPVITSVAFRGIRRIRFGPDGTAYVVDPDVGAIHVLADRVPLKGIEVSPTIERFAAIGVGYTLELPFTVANIGQSAVTISALRSTGSGFAIEANGIALPTVLAPGDTRTAYATYSPRIIGNSTGSLVVESDAEPGVMAVPLTGRGIAATTVSVMLVLDRSGSMSDQFGPTTKMAALKQAVTTFFHVLPPDVGHAVGIVSFSSSATLDGALQPLTAASATQLESVLGPAFVPGGSTAIGQGLQAAFQQLNSVTTDRKVVLVLTDGIENVGPMIAAVPVPADVTISAIGIGEANEIDVAKLARLATHTAGTFFLTDTDRYALPKFLVQVAANESGQQVLHDPPIYLDAKARTGHVPINVTIADRTLCAAVTWDPVSAVLDARFIAPDGERVDPARLRRDVIRPGTLVMELPLPWQGQRGRQHAGQWNVELALPGNSDNTQRVTAGVVVITQSDIRLVAHVVRPLIVRGIQKGPSPLRVGDLLQVAIRVTARGGAVQPLTFEGTELVGPARHLPTAIGKLDAAAVRNALLSQWAHVPGDLSAGVRLSALAGLVATPVDQRRIPLKQVSASPPVPGTIVLSAGRARLPGVYSWTILVRGTDRHGASFTREARFAVNVEAEVSLAHSPTTLVTGKDAHSIRLSITPRDRYGQALGPGQLSSVTIRDVHGRLKHRTALNDEGSGRYTGLLPAYEHKPVHGATFDTNEPWALLEFQFGVIGVSLPLPADLSNHLGDGWVGPHRHTLPFPPDDSGATGAPTSAGGVPSVANARRPALVDSAFGPIVIGRRS